MTRWQRSALRDAAGAAQVARNAGASWAEVAELLGVTRQAAWARYHQL